MPLAAPTAVHLLAALAPEEYRVIDFDVGFDFMGADGGETFFQLVFKGWVFNMGIRWHFSCIQLFLEV